MVQIKPQVGPHGTVIRANIHHNSDWKLGSYGSWKSSRYGTVILPTQYSPPNTDQQAIRDERGLLRYESCSLDELLRFMKDRHIPELYTGDHLTKAIAVIVLGRADEEAQYTLFLDLPAELRLRIYEIHLQDVASNVSASVHQPPVTLVSRSLRSESLPVFYAGTCLKVASAFRRDSLFRPSATVLQKSDTTRLSHIYNKYLKHIKRVHFQVKVLESGKAFEWMIDVNILAVHRAPSSDENDLFARGVSAKLAEAVVRLRERPGPWVLTRGDLDLFHEAVERGIKD